MVDDSAQLYTMEGIAAAFVILATVYLVAGTTSIYTPGDSHITDMQLEVLGNDVLLVMDTPAEEGEESNLTRYLRTWNTPDFRSEFGSLLNNRTTGANDTLQFAAGVLYRKADSKINTTPFGFDGGRTGYEQAVRVTRLATIPGKPTGTPTDFIDRDRVVMLEVLIWRN
ncbi:MAG: hypothetical protein PHU26_06140 [Methanofollis liminatans]|jgi:hypothetical protein|uniref:Uncharacterized protein n=1 Tax=Methanofollis liminatans DSM 4140 TaxID=28892 RepID=J0RXM7_9EURY|nr:hypothetical protein [Methanofollis liminatans]EJG06286.1 hypothetical protein Metli_0314 [Methanofollis liminatans DSM 4140]MDD3111856.1 hypothetical protein [Methanofollis liminatans]